MEYHGNDSNQNMLNITQYKRETLFPQIKGHIKILQDVSTDVFLNELERELVVDRSCINHIGHKCSHNHSTHFWLRRAVTTKLNKHVRYLNRMKTEPSENYFRLNHLRSWLETFASDQKGTLQKVYISFLDPYGKVKPHWDPGAYHLFLDRYHLVLKSQGTRVIVDSNQVAIFHTGEVWWFNNLLIHEFMNEADQVRIHVIFDLKPISFIGKITNFFFWIYMFLRRTQATLQQSM